MSRLNVLRLGCRFRDTQRRHGQIDIIISSQIHINVKFIAKTASTGLAPVQINTKALQVVRSRRAEESIKLDFDRKTYWTEYSFFLRINSHVSFPVLIETQKSVYICK